jgi:hypothetical protein
MAYAPAQSRALGRGRTRVSVGRATPFYLTPIQPRAPFSARSRRFGRFPCRLPGISPRLPTSTAAVKTRKTHLQLHSAARPVSGFLQVAPIESASARASWPFPGTPARGTPDRALTTSGANRTACGGIPAECPKWRVIRTEQCASASTKLLVPKQGISQSPPRSLRQRVSGDHRRMRSRRACFEIAGCLCRIFRSHNTSRPMSRFPGTGTDLA